MTKKIAYHYSGDNSRQFWNAIGGLRIKKKVEWGELYSLGVALQNLEDQVLSRLYNVLPTKTRKSAWKTK